MEKLFRPEAYELHSKALGQRNEELTYCFARSLSAKKHDQGNLLDRLIHLQNPNLLRALLLKKQLRGLTDPYRINPVRNADTKAALPISTGRLFDKGIPPSTAAARLNKKS